MTIPLLTTGYYEFRDRSDRITRMGVPTASPSISRTHAYNPVTTNLYPLHHQILSSSHGRMNASREGLAASQWKSPVSRAAGRALGSTARIGSSLSAEAAFSGTLSSDPTLIGSFRTDR